jgi:hypothetical protein
MFRLPAFQSIFRSYAGQFGTVWFNAKVRSQRSNGTAEARFSILAAILAVDVILFL